ncbi:MAG: hypothetical protein O7A06_01520, partial [Acidobacteria bacterium]|nr:hypothetical protein [Acidobacteriota bacterium]
GRSRTNGGAWCHHDFVGCQGYQCPGGDGASVDESDRAQVGIQKSIPYFDGRAQLPSERINLDDNHLGTRGRRTLKPLANPPRQSIIDGALSEN